MNHNKTAVLTTYIDQKELTDEQINKLAALIKRKVGVKHVKIERNLVGWAHIIQ